MSEANEPIEVLPPDLSGYRAGALGTDHVHRIESGKPGPHVLVTALVHGNEYCGAWALDALLRARPVLQAGILTAVFVNVGAFDSFSTSDPNASRYLDEDFNRLWTADVLEGSRASRELNRARALRPIVDEADFLLDLHSMQYASPPLLMCGPLAKGRDLARGLGLPYHIVSDAGHRAGRRLRDYGGFGDPVSPKNALLMECGQHWAKSSVAVANTVLSRFLAHLGVLGNVGSIASPAPIVEVTEAVTVSSHDFRFVQPYRGMEVIGRAGTVVAHDGDREIKAPHDDCVLVMPARYPAKGQTAVRFGRFAA